jgi:AbrB family looped-hinge helix DNA binding protein
MPTLSSKRQITLPKELCDRLQVAPGDALEVFEHKGRITVLKKLRGSSGGALKRLKADRRYSDEESLHDALAGKRSKLATKRSAA